MTEGASRIGALTLGRMAEAGDWTLRLAHSRPENLLIWITGGQGRVLIDGRIRGLGMHSALYIPARHLLALELGRPATGHALILPDGPSGQAEAAVGWPQEPLVLRQQDRRAQAELTALFETMGREAAAGGAFAGAALDAHAALAAIWLHRQAETAMLTDRPATAAQRLTRDFCALVARRRGRLIKPGEAAGALGVTPTHLSRVVRAETGRPAAALAAEATLHQARRLLAETPAPVQDIARHLGFRSAAYFAQFLNRKTGKSATALRRGTARP